jgi:vitamin B12 transporter
MSDRTMHRIQTQFPAAAALLLGTVLATGSAAAQAAQAQAATDTFRLGAVVVTATRTAVPLADAPGSVTVVTGAELREHGVHFVADALRRVPGIAVAQSAGPGALTSVFMRGGESDYVQVLVDGVQANDPGGAFNWAHLRAEDIDRIEIVRGPASVLYGSDAVSGVIQIFTRAGGAPRVSASISTARGAKHAAGASAATGATAGTASPDGSDAFGTHAFDASVTGSSPLPRGTLSYGASGGRTLSDGLYAYNSDYDNTTFAGKVGWTGSAFDMMLTARRTAHQYHYPTSGSGMVFDRNQVARGTAAALGLDLGYRVTQRIEMRALTTLHAADARTENPPDTPDHGSDWSTADQTRRGVDVRANIELPLAAVLTVGAEREWQRATTAFESVSQFGTFADSSRNRRSNTGWYAQLHGSPVRAIVTTVGARIDDNETFGTFRTARAAVGWRPRTSLRLHAALGSAFKEPTFYENFATGFVRGNPALQPERSHSRELGVEQTFVGGRGTAAATWFDQRFRNLIQYTFTAMPGEPNYHNVGAARARGLELAAQLHAARASLNGAYTFTDTRVTDEGFGTDPLFQHGEPLLRRARHTAVLGAAAQLRPAVRALVDVRYVGERHDLDFTDPAQWSGVRTTLEPYTSIDAGATYLLQRGRTSLEAGLHVRNVFDTEYAEIYNFPAPGRVLELRLRAGM